MSDLPTEQLSALLETFSKGFEIDGKIVKLTAKQMAFVRCYVLNGGNGTQAAKAAGYKGSERTLSAVASENIAKKYIAVAIQKGKAQQEVAYRELNIIELDNDVMRRIARLFKNSSDVNNWAKQVISEKAYELGISLVKSRRGWLSSGLRYDVMARAGFKCQCCGESPKKDNDVVLNIDHIVPVSLGGSDDFQNLQCLCRLCNTTKRNNHDYNHNRED